MENDQDFSWPQPVDTRGMFAKRLHKKREITLYAGIAVAVLTLSLSIALFFFSGSDKPMVPVQTAEGAAAEKSGLTADVPPGPGEQDITDAMAFDNTVQRPPATENNPDNDMAVEDERQATDNEELSDSSIDALAALVSQKKPSRLLPSTQDTGVSSRKGRSNENFNRQAADLLKKLPNNLIPPANTVDGSWLKLHAISWSGNPANRIAVINSQVVKEGRRVDGGLVKRIDKDYVVIEKDGEELMLPFNHH